MKLAFRLIAVVSFGSVVPLIQAEDFAAIPFETRMKQAADTCKNIRVDGYGRDWINCPARFTSLANAAGDTSRDLISTRVLADETGLRVCLSTRGAPSKDASAFGFKLDFAETEMMDVDFSESAVNHCPTVKHIAPGSPNTVRPIQGVEFAVAECVEWFVPWESLAQALPESERGRVVGPNVRSWVRVTPYTFNQQKGAITDYGAAAACVRLPMKVEVLDPSLPGSVEQVEIPLMVEGQSYVMTGAHTGPHGTVTHKNIWAYDLSAMTVEHFYSKVPSAYSDNTQYPAYGRKLFAPVAGRIVHTLDSTPDHPAHTTTKNLDSNYVALKFDENVLWFGHHMKGTLVPQQGQDVSVGDPIAKIGNSGTATWPHVHIQVLRRGTNRHLIPIVLKDVRVSLNGGGNDYWARNLSQWPIREGFFVETTAPLVSPNEPTPVRPPNIATRSGTDVIPPPVEATPKPDAAEQLKKVKALFDQGLISKEEFDKKKKEIMESL